MKVVLIKATTAETKREELRVTAMVKSQGLALLPVAVVEGN